MRQRKEKKPSHMFNKTLPASLKPPPLLSPGGEKLTVFNFFVVSCARIQLEEVCGKRGRVETSGREGAGRTFKQQPPMKKGDGLEKRQTV